MYEKEPVCDRMAAVLAITTNKGLGFKVPLEIQKEKTVLFNGEWFTQKEWDLYKIENNIPDPELPIDYF